MAIKKIGLIADIIMGQSPTGDTCNESGKGLPLLNGPTEFGSYHPYPVQFTIDPKKIARPGDLLFCVRGSTTGKMNWADREYAIGRGIAAIRHKKGEVFQPFLRGLIEQNLPELLDQATGSTFPNVSFTQLTEIACDIPSFDDQMKISEFLRSFDDKIELNCQMNETLEGMARTIFLSWFVDFDPVRAKTEGRDTGLPPEVAVLFPDGFEKVDEREVPRGWKLKEIRDETLNIQYGLTQSATQEEIGPKFLRITDIQGGKINWDNVPFCVISPEDFEKYRINIGDIFVARTGASTGENIYIIDAPNSVFASYLVRFQFKVPSMARVVGEFMRTEPYFEFVRTAIGGSAQPNASAQVLASAQFVFPTQEIAEAFAKTVAPLDRMRAINEQQSRSLAQIRDALLPKLMSGEIRISEIES
jgi:type I restriction enzyme S subunit